MEEKRDLIIDTILHLEDAANYLKELGHHENDVDVLGDIIRQLEFEQTDIENRLYAESERERAALNREYLRSVL